MNLLELPFDLLYHITHLLDSDSLLNLAKTCSSLQRQICEPHSHKLWLNAYRVDIDLPAPPPGMSQEEWDALIFREVICDNCENILEVIAPFRDRFCEACYDQPSVFVSRSSYLFHSPNGEDILDLLPYVDAHNFAWHRSDQYPRIKPRIGEGNGGRFYLLADVTKVEETLASFMSRINSGDPDAAHEMAEYRSSAEQSTEELSQYNRGFMAWLGAQKIKRRDAILNRLLRKYAKRDIMSARVLSRTVVDKYYTLTDKEWSFIAPELEELVEEEHQARRHQKRTKIMQQRVALASDLYHKYQVGLLPAESLDIPSTTQLLEGWLPLKALLGASHNKIKESEYLAAFNILPLEIQRQRHERRSYLESLIPSSNVSLDRLALATSVFTCRPCHGKHFSCGSLITWDAIRQHQCSAQNAIPLEERLSCFDFDSRGAAAVKSLSGILNLNSKSVVPRDFDRLDHRFICGRCPRIVGLKRSGQYAMSWRQCVTHWSTVEHEGHKHPQWSILAPLASADVKRRETRHGVHNAGWWRCNHHDCAMETAGLSSMRTHLRLVHQVMNAEEEKDMYYSLNLTETPKLVMAFMHPALYRCCRCPPPKNSSRLFDHTQVTQHLGHMHCIDEFTEGTDYAAVEMLVT
ncbi:hypothetical protein HGRIS_004492 [Hohenbuehelia grisea]|uniref:F-box domain-containing protein n=1 Tax=Hohenbuehelia grisea TaxID=104357 RepID=A0ABR3JC07_9AGAR